MVGKTNRMKKGAKTTGGLEREGCSLDFLLFARFFRSSTPTETLAQVTFALTIFISVRKINASFEFKSL